METLTRTLPPSRGKKLQRQLEKIDIARAALGLGTTNYNIKQAFEPLSNAKPSSQAVLLAAREKGTIKDALFEQKKFHAATTELKDKVELFSQRTLVSMEKWLSAAEDNPIDYHAAFVRMIKNMEREAQRSISLQEVKKEKALTLKRTIIKCAPPESRPAQMAVRSGSLCFYQKERI